MYDYVLYMHMHVVSFKNYDVCVHVCVHICVYACCVYMYMCVHVVCVCGIRVGIWMHINL